MTQKFLATPLIVYSHFIRSQTNEISIRYSTMETAMVALNVVSKGKKIYEILKSFTDNEIQMYAGKEDWSKSEDKVIFKAVEKPIRTFFTQGFKDYHADKNHMDVFKEIEIIFNNRDFYENFISRYYDRNPVSQKDLIDYLKFVAEKFHDKYDLSMVLSCLKKETRWLENGDSAAPHQTECEIMELKLTFTIN